MHHQIRVCKSNDWKDNGINPGIMPEVLRVAYDNARVLVENDATDTVVFAAIETDGAGLPMWIHVEDEPKKGYVVVIEFGPMLGKRKKLVFTPDFNAGSFKPEASDPRWTTTEVPCGPDEDDEI